ncbi:MAG: hypothetical protein RIQ60_323 [Pseudomonadota bacterium]|jgi:catechol 2,3-dioxygenase-like lactoylglutathione lyase family enzyme
MARVRPQKFVHIVYRTRRFDAMVDWYRRVFDARVQHQNPALAFLTYDDEHHRFAFANLDVLAPGAPNGVKGAIGVDHVAYTYASLEDLFSHYEALKAEGIRPYWCIHHGITISMYYGDPDGNQMEFQIDCFASNDEANAFMAGPEFAMNPIGVEFNPEDWLARVRAGAVLQDFLARQEHLPVSPVRGAIEAA